YLLDEPFNGIDKTNKNKITTYIKNFLKEKTVIIATHHPNELKLINKTYQIKNHCLIKHE
ncbi:ABC transporter ATP-binding protein, partial [Patescibacteria group bacterium]|nr:ABC transporter ATP-binding protein [Patescibacteria group bacterium]